MRLARVQTAGGEILHGVVRGDSLHAIEGDLFGSRRESPSRVLPLKALRLLAPISPAGLLCLGRNFRAHAEEGGDAPPKAPLLFIKAASCVIGPDDPIVIPSVAPGQVDFEAELAVVIGRPARRVGEADALDCVLGYTCANDVSARDCQAGDGQWARSKSFDTFGPLGPWIETELDPSNLRIRGRLNGRTMQEANTSQMLFSVRYVISYLSRGMTLLPGTVLLTGTPAGVGFARKPPVWLKPGDSYEVEIEGIGTLRNSVVADS